MRTIRWLTLEQIIFVQINKTLISVLLQLWVDFVPFHYFQESCDSCWQQIYCIFIAKTQEMLLIISCNSWQESKCLTRVIVSDFYHWTVWNTIAVSWHLTRGQYVLWKTLNSCTYASKCIELNILTYMHVNIHAQKNLKNGQRSHTATVAPSSKCNQTFPETDACDDSSVITLHPHRQRWHEQID